MKTAQELYDKMKEANAPEWSHALAKEMAYNNTFVKGYNPEAMEGAIKLLQDIADGQPVTKVTIFGINELLKYAKLK